MSVHRITSKSRAFGYFTTYCAYCLPSSAAVLTKGFEDMDETFLRNVSRLGSKFKGTELGGAPTGQADEDEDVSTMEEQRLPRFSNCFYLRFSGG